MNLATWMRRLRQAVHLEADAMTKAAKTVITMIESLDRKNFLQYNHLTSEDRDPRKHLEILFALHAVQQTSREGTS